MKIALERLIEGIIATLRADVIPNVSDSYARGQAVGVIDLLNNIGGRVEWARAPLLQAIEDKLAVLAGVAKVAPEVSLPSAGDLDKLGSAELSQLRDRLDATLGDAVAVLSAMRSGPQAEDAREALKLIATHLHDEQTREMKLTRKPLFAEIASGRDRQGS